MNEVTTGTEVLRFRSDVEPQRISKVIEDVWSELQSDSASRQLIATSLRISPEDLIWKEPPFTAKAAASHFGVGTTILIFVGMRFAESLTDKIFDEVFWPRIEAAFGKMVKRNWS
jgi:hypothetical protein